MLRRSCQASQQYAYNVSQALTEPDIVFKATAHRPQRKGMLPRRGQPVAHQDRIRGYCCFPHPTATEFTPRELYAQCGLDDGSKQLRTIDTNLTRLRREIDPHGNYMRNPRLGFGCGFQRDNLTSRRRYACATHVTEVKHKLSSGWRGVSAAGPALAFGLLIIAVAIYQYKKRGVESCARRLSATRYVCSARA